MPIYIPTQPIALQSDDASSSRLVKRQIEALLPLQPHTSKAPITLHLMQGILSLQSPDFDEPICIDFKAAPYRHAHSHKDQPLLAKACGFLGAPLRILDTTAGLGQDSFLMGSLGCCVHALEYHPLIYLLLDNAWHRLGSLKNPLDIHWHLTSAIDYLRLCNAQWDAVLIDPMFVSGKNKALPKKDMQGLRTIAPHYAPNWQLWFNLAAKTTKRIVIKQPKKAPALPLPSPTFQVLGKAMRFDVWCF